MNTFLTKQPAHKTTDDTRRYAKMIARELRAKAAELRRTARVVSDDDIARALVELAEHYEALADATPEDREE